MIGRYLDAAAIGVGIGAIASLLTLPGCGASAATISAYTLEQARCIANEREIVDRAGTTYEEDRAAMDAERERCDRALRAIEEAD